MVTGMSLSPDQVDLGAPAVRARSLAHLSGVAATFVPDDPPRFSRISLWKPADQGARPVIPEIVTTRREIEVVIPAGRSVRRRVVSTASLSMTTAIDVLAGLPVSSELDPTLVAWASIIRFGLSLVARGRLAPAMTPSGVDTWRVGPLDSDDELRVGSIASLLPPLAHSLPVPSIGRQAVRVRSAREAIGLALDAVADTMVRTSAATVAARSPAFAAIESTVVSDWPGWIEAAAHGASAGGARPVIRLDLAAAPAPRPDAGRPEGPDSAAVDGFEAELEDVTPPITAILQLRSTTDPSLVIDAADLWDAPPALLSRLGDEAEADLLLALRRGAGIWAPLERALQDARPSSVSLEDQEVAELFGPLSARLTAAGFDVLWPSAALHGGLQLKASATPSPAAVTKAGLDMEGLLDFAWRVALDGSDLTEDELVLLAEAKRPLVRLRGRWVMADATLIERLRSRPAPLRSNDGLAAALAGKIQIDGELVEIQVEGPMAKLAERLRAIESQRERDEPDGLEATLRPYQRRGLAWLAEMTELGVGGCLADDMGLGKTVQLIALHVLRNTSAGSRPPARDKAGTGANRGAPGSQTLVVCPSSLLGNWEREIRRFAPDVAVRRYHGGDRHLEELRDGEIVLATYGMVRRDRAALSEIEWDLVVADEAQHVKNPLSRTARELRAIPATARVALTGTPVENRLSELWAILDWTTPGLLGPLDEFRRGVAIPIERHGDPEATERLARLVQPFLLRRRKSDPSVAPELPPKTETDMIVPLTDEQVTLYEALARDTLEEIAASQGIARRGLILKLITGLKQITNHPANFLHESGPLPGRSGKLAALDELLDVIVDEGESVLVFSQYVEMGKLLVAHLEHRQVPSLFLNGRTPVPKRQGMVDRFQAGEAPVFVLSLKAAGVGLNLTRATHVVHYDRWWNPAVEDQATDRAHRIGQTRPVQVHRMITEGTVEERVAELLRRKRSLADSVLARGETALTELSNDELHDLVALRRLP